MKFHVTALALLGLLLGTAAHAAKPGTIRVTTTAEKEETVTVDGVQRTRLVPATLVVPGREVIYTVTFENVGTEVATDVAVTNPVPQHTRYVPGSAGGPGTEVQFSVDGGRSFAPAEALTVREADGTERAATAADYTHVRWVLKNPLPPGATAFARYRTRVQ